MALAAIASAAEMAMLPSDCCVDRENSESAAGELCERAKDELVGLMHCSAITRLFRSLRRFAFAFAAFLVMPAVWAEDIQFPQIIRTHYEAKDPAGGQFHLWMEREKVSYGLDARLYPGARTVDITQVTPTVGSITLTYVEVTTVASSVPDYIYVSGNVRFRVSGMILKASNFPANLGMSPRP
jgi:hypothetical protein